MKLKKYLTYNKGWNKFSAETISDIINPCIKKLNKELNDDSDTQHDYLIEILQDVTDWYMYYKDSYI